MVANSEYFCLDVLLDSVLVILIKHARHTSTPHPLGSYKYTKNFLSLLFSAEVLFILF